ncbi:hypothetical protein VCUG_02279 [Vavraia culicis subsp. floridensis]|uniref:Uncharacterized protein n=1 Tax=Vavraia culicis (isolate floridensis) TaxID=948595 RepID=L2GSG1_VAVCU|nr:uncharacterized protein VCUG_02279 [Vavraia culicis subsp. floridensis]ELA46233.1 hypothetical protein VCUG_02279 [Vavraia culicis subsp. floridensis]
MYITAIMRDYDTRCTKYAANTQELNNLVLYKRINICIHFSVAIFRSAHIVPLTSAHDLKGLRCIVLLKLIFISLNTRFATLGDTSFIPWRYIFMNIQHVIRE